jgi:hydrogenase small subunit
MQLSRREFLKAAAAITVTAAEFSRIQEALAGNGDAPVIWLQGQGCTGCSVSFLNSVYYATVDSLLLNTISLEYHSSVMAAAGDFAISAASITRPSPAEISAMANDWLATGSNLTSDLNGDKKVNWLDYALLARRGYILVVEGAIPTASGGLFCTVGGEMTMLTALQKFSQYASAIIAVGTCASFGGVSAAAPNNTAAKGVKDALAYLGISKPVINISGCPVHPDWLVGTLSYFLLNGKAPALDSSGRPTDYFGALVHDNCPNLGSYNSIYAPRMSHAGGQSCLTCHTNADTHVPNPRTLGSSGCLYALNCKGKQAYCDCPTRKWNSPGAGQIGVNWCIGANAPCNGCTQPNFPDGMSPLYTPSGPGANDD